MNTAIVFNCGLNGLAIIRELGRKGVPVIALDSQRGLGTFSRYASYLNCPDPSVDEQGFIAFLLKLADSLSEPGVLFPTNDTWALAIERHQSELTSHFLFPKSSHGAVELVIKKHEFYQWANAHQLPVPGSWGMEQGALLPDSQYPLVAKPASRRMASNNPQNNILQKQMDHLRLVVLKNRLDRERFIRKNLTITRELILQQYIPGLSDCMYTVGVYADAFHEVRGFFSGRKLRGYPADIGDCMAGQVEHVPDYLMDLTRRICREIGLSGIAEFEFKRHSRTGQFYLIEINPRSWSWVGITPSCGVNLPWMMYCDLTGLQPLFKQGELPTDGSVKWVRILHDLLNCLFRYRRSGFPTWNMSLREWRKSLRAKKLVIAEFSGDDWLPGLVALVHLFVKG